MNMFHPSLMQDLLQEARSKNLKTKKAIKKIADADPKYKTIQDMHIDLVTRAIKNEQ